MFNQNVKARFRTSLDSIYTVDEKGMIRHKVVADPHHKNERVEKNIFYIESEAESEKYLKDCNSGWDESYVVAFQEDIVQMALAKKGEKTPKFYELTRTPKVGLAPLDLYLDANGKAA